MLSLLSFFSGVLRLILAESRHRLGVLCVVEAHGSVAGVDPLRTTKRVALESVPILRGLLWFSCPRVDGFRFYA